MLDITVTLNLPTSQRQPGQADFPHIFLISYNCTAVTFIRMIKSIFKPFRIPDRYSGIPFLPKLSGVLKEKWNNPPRDHDCAISSFSPLCPQDRWLAINRQECLIAPPSRHDDLFILSEATSSSLLRHQTV